MNPTTRFPQRASLAPSLPRSLAPEKPGGTLRAAALVSGLAALLSFPGAMAGAQQPCIPDGSWSLGIDWGVTLTNGMLATKGVYARKVLAWGTDFSLFPLEQVVSILDPDNPQQPAGQWTLNDVPGDPAGVLRDGVLRGSAHTWSRLGDGLIFGGQGNVAPAPSGARNAIRFRPDAPGAEWFQEPPMFERRHKPSATLVPPHAMTQPPDLWRALVNSGTDSGVHQNNYEVFEPNVAGGAIPGAWAPPGSQAGPQPPTMAPMDEWHPRQMLAHDGLVDVLHLRDVAPGVSARWDPQAPPGPVWSPSLSILPADQPRREEACMVPRPAWPWLTADVPMVIGGWDGGTGVANTVLEGRPWDAATLPNFWPLSTFMNHARRSANAVLTPGIQVVVTGGFDAAGDPVLAAERLSLIYHAWPTASHPSWQALAAQSSARGDGSFSLLCADGRILDAGGFNRQFHPNPSDFAFYSPPELTCTNPPVPLIHFIDNPVMTHGQQRRIHLFTEDTDVGWVFFLRPGSATGGFDFDQRLVFLSVDGRSGDPDDPWVTFTVPGPTDPNWPAWLHMLRPGYWLVWVAKGVLHTPQPSFNSIIVRIT